MNAFEALSEFIKPVEPIHKDNVYLTATSIVVQQRERDGEQIIVPFTSCRTHQQILEHTFQLTCHRWVRTPTICIFIQLALKKGELTLTSSTPRGPVL
jgi:hypothetical protein